MILIRSNDRNNKKIQIDNVSICREITRNFLRMYTQSKRQNYKRKTSMNATFWKIYGKSKTYVKED